MKDESTTKSREEKFPGESIIVPHLEQVKNLMQTFDALIVERLRAQETVVSVGSAMTESFNLLLSEFNVIVNELKDAHYRINILSKEVSTLAQENNKFQQPLEQIKRNVSEPPIDSPMVKIKKELQEIFINKFSLQVLPAYVNGSVEGKIKISDQTKEGSTVYLPFDEFEKLLDAIVLTVKLASSEKESKNLKEHVDKAIYDEGKRNGVEPDPIEDIGRGPDQIRDKHLEP